MAYSMDMPCKSEYRFKDLTPAAVEALKEWAKKNREEVDLEMDGDREMATVWSGECFHKERDEEYE